MSETDRAPDERDALAARIEREAKAPTCGSSPLDGTNRCKRIAGHHTATSDDCYCTDGVMTWLYGYSHRDPGGALGQPAVAAAFDAEGASVEHVPPDVGPGEGHTGGRMRITARDTSCLGCGHTWSNHNIGPVMVSCLVDLCACTKYEAPVEKKPPIGKLAWTRVGYFVMRREPGGVVCMRPHGQGLTLVLQRDDVGAVAAFLSAAHRAEQCNAIEDTTADLMRDRASRASTLDDNADVAPQYATLRRVLDHALEQASVGKGAARHAQPGVPFEEQPLVQICQWLGSNHFALGQAIKKLRESARLPKEQALADILGAINYAAAAYLERERLP